MSIRLTSFTKLLTKSIDFICDKFPQDRDISYTAYQISLSISVSPRLVLNTFMNNIVDYKQKIVDRDASFFLTLSNGTDGLQCFNLGEKWELFDSLEKEFVFQQVAKLIALGTLIQAE